ncbi:MAG: exosortase A [Azonexus sp.]
MSTATINRHPIWQPTLTTLLLLLAWVLFWYWDTLSAMAVIWARSDTYTHGLIVPPIALWLIWRERAQLKCYQPKSTPWLILPLALIVFLWLLGQLTAVNALTQFAVIAAIILGIMSMLGMQLSARIAFPLAFLLFAVPVGDFMMPRLMEWTANFTVLALRASGIPVYREGLQFVIPSGNWSVVEACSGIRYIIASLTVGTLFAYLNYTSLKRRLIFIGVSLLVPIFANWLRAYLIVMIGHLSSNQLATGADHLIYGWAFFGLVIAIMFMIGMRWSEPPLELTPSAEEAYISQTALKSPWPTALILAIIIAMGPISFALINKNGSSTPPVLQNLVAGNAWEQSTPFTTWKPVFANPSAELQTTFKQNDQAVGLYIAYYRNQDFEKKLVTSTNVLVTSKDPEWSVTSSNVTNLVIAGQNTTVRSAEILHKAASQDNRLTVWQWYWINGHLTSSDIEAKLYAAINRLLGRGDDSAAIIVYAPKDLSGSSQTALNEFVTVNGEMINKILKQTQGHE